MGLLFPDFMENVNNIWQAISIAAIAWAAAWVITTFIKRL